MSESTEYLVEFYEEIRHGMVIEASSRDEAINKALGDIDNWVVMGSIGVDECDIETTTDAIEIGTFRTVYCDN